MYMKFYQVYNISKSGIRRLLMTDNHQGGNTSFWSKEQVTQYNQRQEMISEAKAENINNIKRIYIYFKRIHQIKNASVLDIGCGPGTVSGLILREDESASVTGIDSSPEMIKTAETCMEELFPGRFSGVNANFNERSFWDNINREFDFILSSGAMHYLSDKRIKEFISEIYSHLTSNGIFIASIGTRSSFNAIAEMQKRFMAEFTYSKLSNKRKQKQQIDEFQNSYIEQEAKANINWKPAEYYLDALNEVGFESSDIVFKHWSRSTFIALK